MVLGIPIMYDHSTPYSVRRTMYTCIKYTMYIVRRTSYIGHI